MIKMILAAANNGVIGKNNGLAWRIPEDLKVFKELTMGGILYVGKNTASTLPQLKGRDIVVLKKEGYPTLADIGKQEKEEWIIGGATIYNAALEKDIVDIVYLTTIEREYDGDVFFHTEQFSLPRWELVNEKILKIEDPIVKLQEWHRRR